MLVLQAARLLCAALATAPTALEGAPAGDCERPQFMTRADIPGLGMAEIRDEDIKVSLYGYAESPVTCVTDRTIFEAASLTKPVVGYLVMRLVDQGRFTLDDALIELLPSLPLPSDDPRSAEVTVRMALAHSTGLDGPDDAELSFVDDPGATFRYYPAGYRLVQRIIEHIESESLEAVMQREVFAPLGMQSSSLVFRGDLVSRVALRHRILGEPLQRDRNPAAPPSAAASLITTPLDYGKFLRAAMSGDSLSEASRTAMFTPAITVPNTNGAVAWGIGWGLEPNRGTFFHYGDDGAAKSFVIGADDAGESVVYFANSYYGMAIAGEIAERVAPGVSPGVEWLGYSSWNDPERLARRDAIRAFADGETDLGMETFLRLAREHPELDMDNNAMFLQWVLEVRSLHEGRSRIIAWQLEREPKNADHHLNLSRSQRALGDLEEALDSLLTARALADESVRSWIDAQIDWTRDEVLAQQHDSDEPDIGAADICGDYGSWRVVSDDDRLTLQAGEGDAYTLTWMHGTTFSLDQVDWFRLRFVVENQQVTGVIGRYSDGRQVPMTRSWIGS